MRNASWERQLQQTCDRDLTRSTAFWLSADLWKKLDTFPEKDNLLAFSTLVKETWHVPWERQPPGFQQTYERDLTHSRVRSYVRMRIWYGIWYTCKHRQPGAARTRARRYMAIPLQLEYGEFMKVFSARSYFSPIHESFLPRKIPAIQYGKDNGRIEIEHGWHERSAKFWTL